MVPVIRDETFVFHAVLNSKILEYPSVVDSWLKLAYIKGSEEVEK